MYQCAHQNEPVPFCHVSLHARAIAEALQSDRHQGLTALPLGEVFALQPFLAVP